MPLLTPQFKIRKLNGVTEIKMPDESSFRSELAKAMPQYAPLLAESMGSMPSFDTLKNTKEARSFLDVSDNAGKTYTFTLVVRGAGGVITEREVLFVDENKRICAISRWSSSEGVSFRTTN